MNRQTWIVLALVAALGVCGAVGLWVFSGGEVVDSAVIDSADLASESTAEPDAPQRVKVPAVRSASHVPVPVRVASGALSPELDQAYDAAMNTSLRLPSVPSGTSDRDLENAMQQDLLAVTGEVVLAAQAHTEFAKQAPRREADAAVERAAVLYEHLSSTIDESPVPPGLSEPEQAVFQTMLERMASKHARKAAALRAQGVSR